MCVFVLYLCCCSFVILNDSKLPEYSCDRLVIDLDCLTYIRNYHLCMCLTSSKCHG